ncbi:MAG: iron chaperone [Rhizobiaceae bacterium]
MSAKGFQSVDDYIASQPEATQAVLNRVRAIVRRALPKAEEVISYQIPAYKLPGGTALFFAGWKEHYSVYPASEAIVAALGEALEGYKMSKGTIRFPLDKPVPAKLIERFAKLRGEEVAGRSAVKKAKKSKG